MRWMENVDVDGVLSDGWFNGDKSQYLLKLPEEGEFKRFVGNSEGMITFLKLHGAEELDEDVRGCHVDYNNSKGFVTQKDRYGSFVGGDLVNHYRVEEILKDMSDNWGVVWSDKIVIQRR